MCARQNFDGPYMWHKKENTPAGCAKRPAFSPAQPRHAEMRLFPNKAATPRLTARFTFHASRFTVPGSDARTPLADFFSILIEIHRPAHTCTRLIEGGTVQSIQIGPGEHFPPPNPK